MLDHNYQEGVGSFGDDLSTDVSKDSSKLFTKTRNIGTEMKTFLLTFRPVSGFMMGFTGYFSVSLIIQFG